MMRSLLSLLLFALPAVGAPPDFDTAVAPLLVKRCANCHSGDDLKGDLNITKKAAVIPADVWKRVSGDEMPPKKPLTADEKAVLKAWIDAGAKWGTDPIKLRPDPADWWSFQPLKANPDRKVGGASTGAIDHFINTTLKAKGLTPAPPADRRTLIRRLYFDITGLPPTPEQIDTFTKDIRADAYEKLVDELLASPRYGERWARHWLDVVHYGETHGYDKDQPRPNAWPYRDYVIRAFNADKPYSRFVQEQIAGDVLFPGTEDGVTALGFLSAGPWDLIGHAELPESKIDGKVARHLDRDDFVSNTVGTFLSLTAHCAQCHDHKFDPISQREYYGLQAVFAAIDRADRSFDTDPKVTTQRAESDAKRQKLEAVAAVAGPAGLSVDLGAVAKTRASLPVAGRVYAGGVHTGGGNFVGTGASGGKPRPIHLLPRGDVTKPGKAVAPEALSFIPVKFDVSLTASECERRAALAKWLTDADNPLVWRSIVNRVWQYHFGRGLVDTPNDFGRMGEKPTHPELLDWLTAEFRDGGGSMKKLHKRIVTSDAYKRACSPDAANEKLDSDNRYLWRQNRRKLEAEAVRDSILLMAGKLDLTMGGPSFQDFVVEKPEHSPHYQYHLSDPDDVKTHRRAVYRFVVRSKQQPFLAALDCADPSLAVDKRNQTITPQQALALLNNKLTLTMAKHFADRVQKLAADDAGRVAVAFRLAVGRAATAKEAELLAKHAKDHGLASACRAILNLNEFAFVD